MSARGGRLLAPTKSSTLERMATMTARGGVRQGVCETWEEANGHERLEARHAGPSHPDQAGLEERQARDGRRQGRSRYHGGPLRK